MKKFSKITKSQEKLESTNPVLNILENNIEIETKSEQVVEYSIVGLDQAVTKIKEYLESQIIDQNKKLLNELMSDPRLGLSNRLILEKKLLEYENRTR